MEGASPMRRLAAIVCMDVAGYSRLMGADEEGTLVRLKATQREVIDPAIDAHRGRLVKTTGDGFLAEFASVVDAVRCVAVIQRQVIDRAGAEPATRRIVLRIGVNLGDVIAEGGDLHGDGVNLAARLEELAEPGTVCLSGAAYEQVRDRVEFTFEDLGEQALKNIARPVRVWRWSPVTIPSAAHASLPLPQKPSIVVLPFTNMSGDPEQEYFCDGITEDIITALSRFSSLFVIAHSTSLAYRGKMVEVKQLGQELDVRYVVEGSVRKVSNHVRITAQLVQADSGANVWADRYDGDLNDIFALQDDISRRIVGTIAPEIGLAEQSRAGRMPPEALHAYDLAMRSAYLCRRGRDRSDHELVRQARDLATRAVAADSTSVPAYYALAEATSELAELLYFRSDMDTLLESAAAAGEILRSLDPTGYAGYYQIGHAAIRRRRAEEALSNLRRAHELNPNDPRTLQFLGWAEFNSGLAEAAKAHAELALRLSPRDPQRYLSYWVLAFAAFVADIPLEGVAWARKAIEENTSFVHGYGILAACLAQAGQVDAARAAIDFVMAREPEYIRSRLAGHNYFGVPELGERYTRALRAAAGNIAETTASDSPAKP
jgi:adenylate cyclase